MIDNGHTTHGHPDIFHTNPDNPQTFLNVYPPDLRERYPEECLLFRATYDQLFREFLLDRRQLRPEEHDEIGTILLSRNLLLPSRPERFTRMFDVIASILTVKNSDHETAVALVENPAYGRPAGIIAQRDSGVGKTSLTLKLLGIPNFIDQLPPFTPERTAVLEDFPIIMLSHQQDQQKIKIISLDLSYAGLFDGKLMATSIQGVMADSQWDVARNATRVMAVKSLSSYEPHNPNIRNYQIACSKRIVLDRDLFTSQNTLVPLTHLVITNFIYDSHMNQVQQEEIQRKPTSLVGAVQINHTDWVALEELPGDQGSFLAKQVFSQNPLYHTSPFWRINKKHHQHTIEALGQYLPRRVACLYIYPGEKGYTPENAQPIFQAGASLIKEWLRS